MTATDENCTTELEHGEYIVSAYDLHPGQFSIDDPANPAYILIDPIKISQIQSTPIPPTPSKTLQLSSSKIGKLHGQKYIYLAIVVYRKVGNEKRFI